MNMDTLLHKQPRTLHQPATGDAAAPTAPARAQAPSRLLRGSRTSPMLQTAAAAVATTSFATRAALRVCHRTASKAAAPAPALVPARAQGARKIVLSAAQPAALPSARPSAKTLGTPCADHTLPSVHVNVLHHTMLGLQLTGLSRTPQIACRTWRRNVGSDRQDGPSTSDHLLYRPQNCIDQRICLAG